MKNIVKSLLESARRFGIADFAVFKLCLIATGVLLGTYFCDFFAQHLIWVWSFAVLSLIMVFARLLINLRNRE